MPYKGLPRCHCGACDWLALSFAKQSARVKCRECGHVRRTQSVRGIEQLKAQTQPKESKAPVIVEPLPNN